MMNPSQNLKNNFYFKKILKYCSLNIRSYTEVCRKLEFLELENTELKKEILEFFLKMKVVLPDEEYIEFYLNNLSESKGYTYNQLFLKLSKKVQNLNQLSNILKLFFQKTENIQIQRFIEKNSRKLSKINDINKRLLFLTSKGFKYDISKKYLKMYNL